MFISYGCFHRLYLGHICVDTPLYRLASLPMKSYFPHAPKKCWCPQAVRIPTGAPENLDNNYKIAQHFHGKRIPRSCSFSAPTGCLCFFRNTEAPPAYRKAA